MCLLQSVSSGLIVGFQGVKESHLEITKSIAFWLLQFNTCSVGYCCDVRGLIFVGCLLGHFNNGMLGKLFYYLSLSHYFVRSF
jgi:hypothetical protein